RTPVGKDPRKPVEKTQKPLVAFTKEMLVDAAKGRIKAVDLLAPKKNEGQEVTTAAEDEEEGRNKKAKGKGSKAGERRGEVGGRNQRKLAREERAKERKVKGDVRIEDGKVKAEFEDEGAVATKVRDRRRKQKEAAPRPGVQQRHGRVALEMPITVRSLSLAL